MYCSICIPHGGVTTRRLHLEDERIPNFEGNRAVRFVCLGVARYLPVLYFPASACQSWRSLQGADSFYWSFIYIYNGKTVIYSEVVYFS